MMKPTNQVENKTRNDARIKCQMLTSEKKARDSLSSEVWPIRTEMKISSEIKRMSSPPSLSLSLFETSAVELKKILDKKKKKKHEKNANAFGWSTQEAFLEIAFERGCWFLRTLNVSPSICALLSRFLF